MLLSRHGPSRRVVVTGAAGLIGGALCGELAARGHAVQALLHRSRDMLRLDGCPLITAPFLGESRPGVVTWRAGDICRPGLGLVPSVSDAVDVVVHCAAVTNFGAAPEDHYAVNDEATANVLAFAASASGRPGLVHVGTAYACGERSGPIEEAPLSGLEMFANAYEASKAGGEARVMASGVRAVIARPSIVVGASQTGAIGRFENIYGLLRLIGAGRIKALPATPGATLDLVPIDHVVGGLVDIVERFDKAPDVLHLVSGDPAPVSALAIPVYPGFHVPELLPPDAFHSAELPASERDLYERSTRFYASYLRRDPRFVARKLHALSGRHCPPTGPDFLRRIVAYAVEAGYLRPDPALMQAAALT